MNTQTSPHENTNRTEQAEPTDPVTLLLFLIFIASLGYLVIGSSVGLYPWVAILEGVYFIPTVEAAITFLGITTIMFVSLIGGLLRMKYNILLVGGIALLAVFLLTFWALLLFASLTIPIPP